MPPFLAAALSENNAALSLCEYQEREKCKYRFSTSILGRAKRSNFPSTAVARNTYDRKTQYSFIHKTSKFPEEILAFAKCEVLCCSAEVICTIHSIKKKNTGLDPPKWVACTVKALIGCNENKRKRKTNTI